MNDLLDAAIAYAAMGWHIFPCKPLQKVPATAHGVKDATTDPDKIRAWWARWPDANIGLACGETSGVYVVDIDVDETKGVNGFASMADLGPTLKTVEQTTPRGGAHYFFKAAVPPRNKNGFRPGIDIRGEGYYVVLAPSVNGVGRYAWENPPTTNALAEWPEQYRPEPEKPRLAWDIPRTAATRPAGASDVRARASAYLAKCDPAMQGHGGHAALLKAARSLVEGFALSQSEALDLLWSEYNPRCSPPWDQGKPSERRDFERKVTEALKTPRAPTGHLAGDTYAPSAADLEIGRKAAAALLESAKPKPKAVADKAPTAFTIPEHLFNVPGLVSKVMEYCLQTAPYPNRALAFAGALALQAFLCSRKVRTEGDLRPNLYLLALAPSGAGKDWPRKLNKEILFRAGYADAVGDRFASAEGIEDEIFRNHAILFQTDEFDGLIQAMSKTGEPLFENMMGMLLTLYGSASTYHYRRKKAGDQSGGAVNNPHLNLFGTAIPIHFYNALNERMLTNGLLSRMLILDAAAKRAGQRSGIIDPPDAIVGIAKWWREKACGGDLAMVNPEPMTVPATAEAAAIFDGLREECDAEYNAAAADDEVRRTVYSRICEMAQKLALIYAVSASAGEPVIDGQAARWAAELATTQANRMLTLAARWACQSDSDKACAAIIAKLAAAPDQTMKHADLLRRSKMDSKAFDAIIQTLTDREEITVIFAPSKKGPPGRSYILGNAEE
jgi:hypothetical protein